MWLAASPQLYTVNVTTGIIHRRETFRFVLNENKYTIYRCFAAREIGRRRFSQAQSEMLRVKSEVVVGGRAAKYVLQTVEYGCAIYYSKFPAYLLCYR